MEMFRSQTLSCSAGYTLVDHSCGVAGGSITVMDTYCYLNGINSLYISTGGGSNYRRVCGSIKCCNYVTP